MAEKFRFMDPVQQEDGTYDREYNAQEFTDYIKALVTTGVMKSAGNQLAVSANGSNMITKIDTGIAFILGRYYENDSFKELTHDTESLGVSRIDRVVIRMDLSTDKRHVLSFIKKGVPSTNPVAPALTQTPNIYEISLAQVTVVGGQTFIAADAVTSERGIDVICPWCGSNILPNFDNAALEQVIQKVDNSWQKNQWNDTSKFNLDRQLAQRTFEVNSWNNNNITSEVLDVTIPVADFSGILELDIVSVYSASNAGGGARVIFELGATNSGYLYTNNMKILNMSSHFSECFFISNIAYNDAGLYYFNIIKRAGANPLKFTITARDTVDDNNSNALKFIDSINMSSYPLGYLVGPDERPYQKDLFGSVGEGKASNVNALAQMGVHIPSDASFADISAGILSIQTGRKQAAGYVNLNAQHSFNVNGLAFKPSIILVMKNGGTSLEDMAVYVERWNFYESLPSNDANFYTFDSAEAVDKKRVQYGQATPFSGGFGIRISTDGLPSYQQHTWVALGAQP